MTDIIRKFNPDDDESFGDWLERAPRKEFKPSTLETYRTDAVMVRSFKPACAGTVSQRGKIGNAPTRRSLNRLVFLLNNCDTPMQSMLTITMAQEVSDRNSVEYHNKTLKAALEKLRRDGINQYCWVREFQGNESVHWHVFTDLVVGDAGEINEELSNRWRRWMVARYRKSGWISERCQNNMLYGNGDDFFGCCRFEQMHGDIGGKYAGKEGSKRFQKVLPKRWHNSGGAWWRPSRNVKCTPTGEKKINGDTLDSATVKIGDREIEVPYRIQFNRGQPGSGSSE